MIITRTPLRISLGGGGTDLPTYYREAGPRFPHRGGDHQVRLHRGARQLRRRRSAQVLPGRTHPRSSRRQASVACERHCFSRGIDRGIEITSMADIPTGTGLGSSGSFTVGVLKALRSYQHELVSNAELARAGLSHRDRSASVNPLASKTSTSPRSVALTAFKFHARRDASRSCRSTSPTRQATCSRTTCCCSSRVCGDRRPRCSPSSRPSDRPAASQPAATTSTGCARSAYDTKQALETGDLVGFGQLLTDQWKLKYEPAPAACTPRSTDGSAPASDAGALGGKLVGAGGGGFLLFYAEEKAGLRPQMADVGLEEVRFGIDYHGSTTLFAG